MDIGHARILNKPNNLINYLWKHEAGSCRIKTYRVGGQLCDGV